MEIGEILDRINRSTGRFEREAVEAAMLRQEELTPELLQILQKLLRILENAPEMYAEIDPPGDYTAHLYAMFLLGQFQETRAHDLLLRFGSLPGELLDRVCGEFLNSEFLYALESEDLADVDRALAQEFPGMRRRRLDHYTGKRWWTRSNRNP